MRYRMYFRFSGSVRIEESFKWHGFLFQKTNAGMGAMFDFDALDQEAADAQSPAIQETLDSLLDMISLEFRQDIVTTSVQGPMVPQPHCNVAVAMPLDAGRRSRTDALQATTRSTSRSNPRIPLAARWFRKALAATDCTDAFLAAWISLEALAEVRDRPLSPQEECAIKKGKECIKYAVPHALFPETRSRFICQWLDATEKVSIPEAMSQVIKAEMGKDFLLLGQAVDTAAQELQRLRSDLVHNGAPIPGVCEKARAIVDVAWRVLHSLVKGTGLLHHLNVASREELLGIPDLGDGPVHRMLAERDSLGGFKSLEQLAMLPGIGERGLDAIRLWHCSR